LLTGNGHSNGIDKHAKSSSGQRHWADTLAHSTPNALNARINPTIPLLMLHSHREWNADEGLFFVRSTSAAGLSIVPRFKAGKGRISMSRTCASPGDATLEQTLCGFSSPKMDLLLISGQFTVSPEWHEI
jgi:hypothetical protein